MRSDAEDEDIFVYVISSDVGPIKIGISNNPFRRFNSAYLAGYPKARRRLCGFWRHPLAGEIEYEAHQMLTDRRFCGEWFSVSLREAYAAIMTAMEQVEIKAKHKALLSQKTPLLTYDGPVTPRPSDGKFRLGYVRDIPGVGAMDQIRWMVNLGVDSREVWHEIESSKRPELFDVLREAEDGNLFYVWSLDVLGEAANKTLEELREKNVSLICADSPRGEERRGEARRKAKGED